jgi:hypothetical protein
MPLELLNQNGEILQRSDDFEFFEQSCQLIGKDFQYSKDHNGLIAHHLLFSINHWNLADKAQLMEPNLIKFISNQFICELSVNKLNQLTEILSRIENTRFFSTVL